MCLKQSHYNKPWWNNTSPFLQDSPSSSGNSGFYDESSTELDSDEEHKASTPKAVPPAQPPPPIAPEIEFPTARYLQTDVIVTPPAKPPVAAEQTPPAVSPTEGRIGFQRCCGWAGWY